MMDPGSSPINLITVCYRKYIEVNCHVEMSMDIVGVNHDFKCYKVVTM